MDCTFDSTPYQYAAYSPLPNASINRLAIPPGNFSTPNIYTTAYAQQYYVATPPPAQTLTAACMQATTNNGGNNGSGAVGTAATSATCANTSITNSPSPITYMDMCNRAQFTPQYPTAYTILQSYVNDNTPSESPVDTQAYYPRPTKGNGVQTSSHHNIDSSSNENSNDGSNVSGSGGSMFYQPLPANHIHIDPTQFDHMSSYHSPSLHYPMTPPPPAPQNRYYNNNNNNNSYNHNNNNKNSNQNRNRRNNYRHNNNKQYNNNRQQQDYYQHHHHHLQQQQQQHGHFDDSFYSQQYHQQLQYANNNSYYMDQMFYIQQQQQQQVMLTPDHSLYGTNTTENSIDNNNNTSNELLNTTTNDCYYYQTQSQPQQQHQQSHHDGLSQNIENGEYNTTDAVLSSSSQAHDQTNDIITGGHIDNTNDNIDVNEENDEDDVAGEQLACKICRGKRMCFCYFLKVGYYKFPSYMDLVDYHYKKWRTNTCKQKAY